jgi:hypothetical protein
VKVVVDSFYVHGGLELDQQPAVADDFYCDLGFYVCQGDSASYVLGHFDVRICTPKFMDRMASDDMWLGRGLFIVKRWNPERVLGHIRQFVEKIEADTWEELAELISRIARWEDELDAYMDWEQY